MQQKTYRGSSMSEVLRLVRQELGNDAVILDTRELRYGLFEVSASPLGPPEPPVQTSSPRSGSPISSRLKAQGVADGLIQNVIETTVALRYQAQRNPLEEAISSTFEFTPALPHRSKVVALVGPTGVGKTTTIAKLAARIREAYGIRIALIAADTYRIGGGYQLHTYATLLKMPCRVLSADKDFTQQLREAIEGFRHYDLVLVDTNGCSPRDEKSVLSLQTNLTPFPEIERLLVLPAPSNEIDLRAAASRFVHLDVSRVVISKLDESGYIGPVVNTAHALGRPLAFFTTGQRVPEDIEPATARRLAWMLLRQVH